LRGGDSSRFGTRHFIHTELVNRYNQIDKIFIASGYFINEKYVKILIRHEDLNSAFNAVANKQ